MRCGAFHRVEGTLCLVRHGQAALSGSKTKAPGFAGGYLLSTFTKAPRVMARCWRKAGRTSSADIPWPAVFKILSATSKSRDPLNFLSLGKCRGFLLIASVYCLRRFIFQAPVLRN